MELICFWQVIDHFRGSGNGEIFLSELCFIERKLIRGEGFFCEMEAGPCAPATKFTSRAGHARCQMLKMPNRVANEEIRGSVFQKPYECPVREWPGWGGDLGQESFVELENGLCWFVLLPKRLREFKTGEIVLRATFFSMLPSVRCLEVGGSRREVRIHPRGWKFL